MKEVSMRFTIGISIFTILCTVAPAIVPAAQRAQNDTMIQDIGPDGRTAVGNSAVSRSGTRTQGGTPTTPTLNVFTHAIDITPTVLPLRSTVSQDPMDSVKPQLGVSTFKTISEGEEVEFGIVSPR